MNRYNFYTVFSIDPTSLLLQTIYPTYINGLFYPKGTTIPRGLSFGGLNLYNYAGRDVAATWTPNALLQGTLSSIFPPTLTIVGFY